MNNWYKFKFSFKIKIYSMHKTRFFSKYFQAILIDVRIYMYKSNTCMYIYIYKIWIKSVEPFHTGANQSFSAWIFVWNKKMYFTRENNRVILYSISGILLPRVFLSDTYALIPLSSLPFTLKFTTVAHSTKFHESRQLFTLKRNSISGEFLNVHSWFV